MKDEGRQLRDAAVVWLRQGRQRWVILVALAVIMSLVILASLNQPAAVQSSLASARLLWAANGVERYRLQLTQYTRVSRCDQEMSTVAGKATPIMNSCGMPATWTVPRLFDWIEELEREQTRCYPSTTRCACRITMYTTVSYDQVLGFPSAVTYKWRSQPNLIHPVFWQTLSDRTFPGCSNIQGSGPGGMVTVEVDLEPEP